MAQNHLAVNRQSTSPAFNGQGLSLTGQRATGTYRDKLLG
jgi:hypothetical protein